MHRCYNYTNSTVSHADKLSLHRMNLRQIDYFTHVAEFQRRRSIRAAPPWIPRIEAPFQSVSVKLSGMNSGGDPSSEAGPRFRLSEAAASHALRRTMES